MLSIEGFLKVTAMAKGASGNKVKCVFYFPTDPGYRDTARMLVESGAWRGFPHFSVLSSVMIVMHNL